MSRQGKQRLVQVRREPRLYVVSALRHLNQAAVGETSWWCVDSAAQPGERAAIHVTKVGVSLLFTVTNIIERHEPLCVAYGMKTASVRVDFKLDPPLAAREMRNHPVLSKLPALRRSFQRSSFPLPEVYFASILEEAERRKSTVF